MILVRSAVPTRDVGHLPGDLNEKLEPYEAPYRDILTFLMKNGNPNTYDYMKEAGIIEFMPTSYIRVLNWDDAVVVIDDAERVRRETVDVDLVRKYLGVFTR